MEYFLFVVEGVHDVALIGSLLKRRGFSKTELLSDADSFWKPLIPRKFPNNPQERLDHVIHFPDLYTNPAGAGRSVALSSSGGYNSLIEEFQATLNGIRYLQRLTGIAIIADADTVDPPVRFAELCQRLVAINEEGIANSRDGFPLAQPAAAGVVTDANPRFGIYILPDNVAQGTLESLLLECAASSYRPWYQPAIDFVDRFDIGHPDAPEFRELRKPNGKQKAAVNILGNLLVYPGASLAAAISRGAWFAGLQGTEPGFHTLDRFLADLLGDAPTPAADIPASRPDG